MKDVQRIEVGGKRRNFAVGGGEVGGKNGALSYLNSVRLRGIGAGDLKIERPKARLVHIWWDFHVEGHSGVGDLHGGLHNRGRGWYVGADRHGDLRDLSLGAVVDRLQRVNDLFPGREPAIDGAVCSVTVGNSEASRLSISIRHERAHDEMGPGRGYRLRLRGIGDFARRLLDQLRVERLNERRYRAANDGSGGSGLGGGSLCRGADRSKRLGGGDARSGRLI